MNRPNSFIKSSVVALLLSLPLMAVMNAAVAQIQFSAPPVSAPGNRESGASRSDSCAMPVNDRGLTAVIPETNVGLTTQALPKFFAYIPTNNAERAEFRLIDEETGDEIYAGQFPLPPTEEEAGYRYAPSIVGLSVSSAESTVVLEPGKTYLWALMLVCNSENRAEDIVVTGVVQRPDTTYFDALSPDVRDQLSALDTLSLEEQLAVYGEAGMWHDLLQVLASLTHTEPNTYQNDWRMLLGEQGLGAIANSPIIFSEVEPL